MLGYNDEKESSSSSSEEDWLSFLLNNPRYSSPRNAQQWSSPAELFPKLDLDLPALTSDSDDDEDTDNDSLLSRVITGLDHNTEDAELNTSSIENFERLIKNTRSNSFWRSFPVPSSSESSESFGCLLESKEDSEEEVEEYNETEEELLSDLLPYDLWTDELIDFTEDLYHDEPVQDPVLPSHYPSEEEDSEVAVAEEDLSFYSSGEEEESDYIVLVEEPSHIDSDSANSYTTAVEDENDDPTYQMVVDRSLFEEWLLLREGELLKAPESISLLCIIRDTVLSPVATLVLKFNAPSEWRSCHNCHGFIETHCCLYSHEESDDEGLEDEDEDDDFQGVQLYSNDEDDEQVDDFPIDYSTYYSLGHVGHDQLMSFIQRIQPISLLH